MGSQDAYPAFNEFKAEKTIELKWRFFVLKNHLAQAESLVARLLSEARPDQREWAKRLLELKDKALRAEQEISSLDLPNEGTIDFAEVKTAVQKWEDFRSQVDSFMESLEALQKAIRQEHSLSRTPELKVTG